MRSAHLRCVTDESVRSLVGARGGRPFEFTRINIALTIQQNQVEDLRYVGALMSIAA
jgi:hypothetical protein